MAWYDIDKFLERLGIRVGAPTLEQTTAGSHTPGSHHYDGDARDYGRSNSDVDAITAALLPHAQGEGAPIIELFDSRNNVFYDNGVAFTPDAELRRTHYSHVHVAVRPGATLEGLSTPVDSPSSSTSSSSGGSRLGGVGRVAVEGVAAMAAILLVVLGVHRATKGAPA